MSVKAGRRHSGRVLAAALATAFGLVAPATAAGGSTTTQTDVPRASTVSSWSVSRVSVGSGGRQASGTDGPDEAYRVPAISGDGSLVAFSSTAENLVRGDTNGTADVFVRDRVRDLTVRVSVGPSGREADGASSEPAVSADGRFVAFASRATNLGRRDSDARQDVFVRDRHRGVTRLVSVSLPSRWAKGAVGQPSISRHGRFVAFVSTRRDPRWGTVSKVFVRDRHEGTTRAVVASASRNPYEGRPQVSAHGRFVVLESSAALTPDDRDEGPDVFVVDRRTGAAERVAIGRRDRAVQRVVVQPAISSDAGRVAVLVFTGNSRDGSTTNVAVWDRASGRTRIVSTTAAGHRLANPVPPDAARPVGISGGGRFIAFVARAGLVARDRNHTWDVYVRDLRDDSLELVTTGPRGGPADDATYSAVVSADGRHVAFLSSATNLVPADTNDVPDVFVARRGTAR